MVYKIISGVCDCNIACQLVKPTHFVTRGRLLFKTQVHYDLHKYI